MNSEARDRAKMVAELQEAAMRANTQAGFQDATVTGGSNATKINKLADAMDDGGEAPARGAGTVQSTQ